MPTMNGCGHRDIEDGPGMMPGWWRGHGGGGEATPPEPKTPGGEGEG
jgi:hypothetical protein